ncbi:hypothetical protein GPJ56_000249 [Histomonas meleagridis]|uniref:uncharacterized protein n=1 Tax=Histomonas meleagridis TaxID=135588 RepID=UPI003559D06D|nr:hypothetical protein GPJ56_000249 [Histomonas meleagridis]KAH0799736.1 hypothetical protein GO595_007457 [Histomonas meleagridis]
MEQNKSRNLVVNFKAFIIIEIISITIIVLEVYICHDLFKLPNIVSFQNPPTITDNKEAIEFTLRLDPTDINFQFNGSGAAVDYELSKFCENKKCKIPLIIGGKVKFTLVRGSKLLYEENLELSEQKFYCTSNDWSTRLCVAHDICYGYDIYSLTSPYPIKFDTPLLTLGSHGAPSDFPHGRIHNFQDQSDLLGSLPYVRNTTNVMFAGSMLDHDWQLYYDFLIPMYLTLTEEGKFQKDHRIFFPFFNSRNVPHISSAFSNYKTSTIGIPMCFEKLVLGMHKVTESKQSPNDPQYVFPSNVDITGFKRIIFNFFDINSFPQKDSSHKKIILVNHESPRKITNIDEVKDALKEIYDNNCDIEIIDISAMSVKSKILKIGNADVLVGAHGSALANLLWMEQGKTVIEIFPYGFNCRNWYEKAAKLSKIKYISYHPKDENELVTKDELDEYAKECYSGKRECNSPLCIPILKEKDINVNIKSFIQEIRNQMN